MSSSRREAMPRQVPAPANSRNAGAGGAGAVAGSGGGYARFIPREELQGFAAWTPNAFTSAPAHAAPQRPVPGALPGSFAELGLSSAAQAAARMNRAGPPRAAANGPNSPNSPDSSAAGAAASRPAAPPFAAAPPEPDPLPTLEELHAEMAAEMKQQSSAARASGYQDGYRDGLVALESFKQSFAVQVSAQIGAVLHALDQELGALEQQMAASVARVATELARQVVRSELSVRPALVAQVAREAINTVLMSARQISVQVHPDDLALVASGCEEALVARGARQLAQPSVARGGCRIESDAGVVDARVAARWAQATHALGTGVAWDDHEAETGHAGGDA